MKPERGLAQARRSPWHAASALALGPALLALAACSGTNPADRPAADLARGSWRAWLDSPGGELPFGLDVAGDGAAPRVTLVNGEERLAVPRVELRDGELTLAIEHYDAVVRATVSEGGRRLDGEWTKTSGPGRRSRLAFHATFGDAPRFAPLDSPAQAAGGSPAPQGVDGRWSVRFASESTPAVGIFRTAADGTVGGTFLTSTGDYRYLAGSFEAGRLRLSCFDGAHAFLFDATMQPDGTLAGDFWSRDTWHDTWTARRDAEVTLPDPFAQTRWTGRAKLADIVFPDLTGRPRSLADPEFAGKARIVEVFGSWCPNCNDAAADLAALHRRYGERGLSIVGLAFEMTGEFERDAEQVRRYAERHGLEFPILLAGTADKGLASEAFPAIDRVRSYPTTIFIDSRDRVRAVYTGYSGPATGEAHRELLAGFEELIERMLADAGA